MRDGFIVSVNTQIVYECNDTRFPARLRRHLDEIETDISEGIQLGDNWVDQPDAFQKQQYIAMVLLNALDKQDTNLVKLLSAYLVSRYTNLGEIRATSSGDFYSFSLINN